MAGVLQTGRAACRLLRPLASANGFSAIQQACFASTSSTGACGQASTSTRCGDEENPLLAPLLMGRSGLNFRSFSSQSVNDSNKSNLP